MIREWRQLESLAIQRQDQSRQLSVIHQDALRIKAALTEAEHELRRQGFEDVTDLETCLKSLQVWI